LEKSYERFSSQVLDAASAPVRLHILKLLASRGPLPYTEIMTESKLDPVRDAGKFVYHLKTLKKAGLVAAEKGTKKYSITELGKILVEFSRDLEEYVAVRKGRLFVRTSRMTIEEFDRTRIARSLVTEAGMPQALANEIASEAEERLLRFGTTYLTAPLIRELVNTILVERKLEEYRHKLTRLGLPVNDVTMLLREAGQRRLDSIWIERAAGAAVTGEYVLLHSMTKPLADAHLSGRIHFEETESWILKPSQFFHDPDPFLEKGLPGSEPPASFEAALGTVQKLISVGAGEIANEQVFDHFNFYLAPFIKGAARQRIQESARLFLYGLNWDGFSNALPGRVTLGIDRHLPPYLSSQPAVGPNGRREGVYGDFTREAEELFQTIIDSSLEIGRETPLVNPAIIVKLVRERLNEPDELLSLVYESSARFSTPAYFVQDSDQAAMVSSEGCVFTANGTQDESRRGAILGSVLVNVPRASYEAAGKDEKFLQNIGDTVVEAVTALELRRESVEQRLSEGLLPLLSWQPDGRAYYGSQPTTAEINLLGLSEAIKHHTHSELGEKQNAGLVKKIFDTVRQAIDEAEVHSLRVRVGIHASPEASSRLAQIDSEKYGFSTIAYQGSKKYPYYTDIPAIPPTQKIPLAARVSLEGEFQKLFDGGAFLPIRIGAKAERPTLSRVTRQLGEAGIRYFAYTGVHYRCQKCFHTGTGIQAKCPQCGSDRLTVLGRCSGRLTPIETWPEARRRDLERLTANDLT
jgi:ribonucleoside-triphosphate reductase